MSGFEIKGLAQCIAELRGAGKAKADRGAARGGGLQLQLPAALSKRALRGWPSSSCACRS